MIKTLEEFSRRIDELRARIREHQAAGGPLKQREPWIAEYRNLLRTTQESPSSLSASIT